MTSPESHQSAGSNLPHVTREVMDLLESRGYDLSEAVELLRQSNPIAFQSVEAFVGGMGLTHSEQRLGIQTAAYLYSLLTAASEAESSDQV